MSDSCRNRWFHYLKTFSGSPSALACIKEICTATADSRQRSLTTGCMDKTRSMQPPKALALAMPCGHRQQK